MSDDEADLFLKEMADVRPLAPEPRIAGRPGAEREAPGLLYRREAAQRLTQVEENQLPTTFVEQVRPEAVISFRRDGIQLGVYRRLQRGAYEIEATLDLQGLTVEEAREALCRFVKDCMRYDVRSALISHGKGQRNKEKIPLLKSFVFRWLPMIPEVMAFHSAQKWHGGAGAVYVLLKKSERAKEVTRERLGLSSGKPER